MSLLLGCHGKQTLLVSETDRRIWSKDCTNDLCYVCESSAVLQYLDSSPSVEEYRRALFRRKVFYCKNAMKFYNRIVTLNYYRVLPPS